ncbi:protein tiptop isoform X2 [Drosophila ananassae]|uniref:protein tiptop isoform X2 n=1 Tax=Drosophila ananassae TaxID=7217 RepID=UPI0013A5E9F3|nr:protein tiptop isoform X2 [Drosophila ananassae]
MMLHEAVMLEIYRQALSASELASPRCQSRESNASAGGAGGGGVGVLPSDVRCPSNESHCSANDCLTPAPTPTPTATPTSPHPVGLPLTATLPPAAAAALLPPQSAAMAAYLAAAQQNHLLLTNPLAAAASLVQQATQQAGESPPALDFSRKRASSEGEDEEEEEEPEQGHHPEADQDVQGDTGPLDLSVSTRKRQGPPDSPPARKVPRSISADYKSPLPPGSWVPPINPYLAAVAAKTGGLGNPKLGPSEASKALEKMSEMSRLETPPPGSHRNSAGVPNTSTSSSGSGGSAAGGGTSSGGRHSAWQSHWLNKGADTAKDVFKCVWCKQSFATLASLTTHMKETQHCGVQIPSPSASAGAGGASSGAPPASRLPASTSNSACSSSSSSTSSSSNSSKSELNMLIKETMPLPRKLVRGQDVWLGKGAEQTRQILKCMWCGQSFRSLAEMTSHMQETQHYTNIISQEQIISWKSGDDRERPSNGSQGPGGAPSAAASAASAPSSATAAAVSAVLTCKVCDQAFGTLKELSSHMAQQSHYKESPSSSVSPPAPGAGNSKRARQNRNEKRKKSLPVRKLLELERSSSNSSLDSALKPLRDFAAATKITCEKCGSKIETALFVEHIRKCLGESIPIPPRRPAQDRMPSPNAGLGGEKPPSVLNALEQLIEKSFESRGGGRSLGTPGGYSETGTPLGASILKRLGIDDSSDYTKPLMDAQAMHMMRSSYASRDRSASESSSASRVESSYTPDRQQATPRRTPDTPAPPPPPPPPPTTIKAEPMEAEQQAGAEEREGGTSSPRQHIQVKKEFSMEASRESPRSASESPAPQTVPATVADSGSLLALNSMFDQLSGAETNNNNNTGHCYNNNNPSSHISSKKPKAHPLAALQKLCETTDPPASNTRSAQSSAGSAAVASSSNGSDLVAFSWACNEAVLSASSGAGGDSSIIKCSFCDTPFGSKGAYRHHLSKVHFVKDAGEESPRLKSPAAQSPKSLPMASPKRSGSASRSPATAMQQPPPSPTINPYDESPQSKFLKYTELAKQLSSKNA